MQAQPTSPGAGVMDPRGPPRDRPLSLPGGERCLLAVRPSESSRRRRQPHSPATDRLRAHGLLARAGLGPLLERPAGRRRAALARLSQDRLFHSRGEGTICRREASTPIPVNISASRNPHPARSTRDVVARDISERVRAAVLRESEEGARHARGVGRCSHLDAVLGRQDRLVEYGVRGDHRLVARRRLARPAFLALVHPQDATRATELLGRALGGEPLPTFKCAAHRDEGASGTSS